MKGKQGMTSATDYLVSWKCVENGSAGNFDSSPVAGLQD